MTLALQASQIHGKHIIYLSFYTISAYIHGKLENNLIQNRPK